MIAIAVRSKSSAGAEARFAACDDIEHTRCNDCPDDLCHNVRQQLRGGKSLAGAQAYRYGGIQMTTRDMSDRVGHGEHGQTERQGDSKQADSYVRESGGNYRAATASQDQPEGTEKFSRASFR